MDSHYYQVMKAREAVEAGPARLYFAYSTILDRAAFDEWKTQHSYQFFTMPEGNVAEALDIDLTYDFQSRWWGGRVAGLVDKKGSKIYGCLFEIPAKDWPIIQHKEGAITGMCVERKVRVVLNGREIEATAFTTAPNRATTQGPISAQFISALLRGAEAANLPKAYLAHIKESAK